MGFKNEISSLKITPLFVSPGETITIRIIEPKADGEYSLNALGPIGQESSGRWAWTAPKEAGIHPIRIEQAQPRSEMLINAFVMVPLSRVRSGRLEQYRIGQYPAKPLKNLPIYKPPKGFIRVTKENRSVHVTPHFRLEQFLCKQAGGFPKFVVLRERLLLKLEYLLRAANKKGIRTDTFAVLSGYRTPFYNKAIGNVRYSRHVWGGAADIFVDVNPKDGMMDDLNKDGTIDVLDAGVLYDLVDAEFGTNAYERFVGGLGRYRKNSRHGPFVHLDTWGFRARWGD